MPKGFTPEQATRIQQVIAESTAGILNAEHMVVIKDGFDCRDHRKYDKGTRGFNISPWHMRILKVSQVRDWMKEQEKIPDVTIYETVFEPFEDAPVA